MANFTIGQANACIIVRAIFRPNTDKWVVDVMDRRGESYKLHISGNVTDSTAELQSSIHARLLNIDKKTKATQPTVNTEIQGTNPAA